MQRRRHHAHRRHARQAPAREARARRRLHRDGPRRRLSLHAAAPADEATPKSDETLRHPVAKLFARSCSRVGLGHRVSMIAAEVYLRPAIEMNLSDRIRDDLLVRLRWSRTERRRARDIARDLGRAGGRSGPARAGTRDVHRRRRPRARRLGGRARELGRAREPPRPPRDRRGAGSGHAARRRAGAPPCTIACMYAAVPLELPDGTRGAARLAVPLAERRRGRCGAPPPAHRAGRRARGRDRAVESSAAAHVMSRGAAPHDGASRAGCRRATSTRATRVGGADEVAELGARSIPWRAACPTTLDRAARRARPRSSASFSRCARACSCSTPNGRILLVNPALRDDAAARRRRRGKGAARADPQRRPAGDPGARLRDERTPVSGEIETAGARRLLVHASPLPPAEDGRRAACWPSSSTSRRSGASRRCARTSSPTSRTSCARP